MNDQPSQSRTRTIAWENPLAVLQEARKMSGMEYLQAVKDGKLPPSPVAPLLGMWMSELEEGRVVFALEPAEYHYNPLGSVHGGITATMLDSAMAIAVHSMLPTGVGYTTLDLTVSYVGAITSKTGIVYSEGKIIHMGSRIATVGGRLTDASGKLYAHATSTCMLFRPEKG